MNFRSCILASVLFASATGTVSSQEFLDRANSDAPVSNELMRAIENAALATLSFAETVRPAIDRSEFDQDALLDRLFFDETEVAEFVTEQIAYEPYAGVLRGAHGTLLARAGNAIDQSLLLATLLNDAGFEAVIRGGTLTNDDAERLLNVMAARPEIPLSIDESVIEPAMAELLDSLEAWNEAEEQAGREPPFTFEQVIESIELDRDALLAALDEAGVALGRPEAKTNLMAEIREYFWVEYRDGPASAWIPAHPAFGTARSPSVEAAETYAGDIPEALTHRIRLELIVDQRLGDQIMPSPILDPMEFPSANVAGQSILLSLFPDALLRTAPVNEGTTPEAETRFLLPIVNGALPPGSQALALNGTLVPPDLIQYSQTGVFETVSGRLEAAANALDGLGGSESPQQDLAAIEAVRLLLTLIHPQAGERTVERYLYQAPGETLLAGDADAATRRAALVSELARSHSIGFVAGGLSPAYVAHEQLTELIQMAPLIRALADPALDQCQSLDCLPEPALERDPSGSNTALIAAFLDSGMPREDDAIVFRDAPNIFRLSQPYFAESAPLPGIFDIVSNARRGFRIRDGSAVFAPELVMLAGIAETHLERIVPGAVPVGSTIEHQPGRRDALPLALWTTDAAAPGPATLERMMMTDAQTAGVAVFSAAAPDFRTGAVFGWWEVDPKTGRTVGMGRFGGQSAIEYLIGFILGTTATGVIACSISDDVVRDTYVRSAPGGPLSLRRERGKCLQAGICAAATWPAMYLNEITDGSVRPRGGAFDRCMESSGGWEFQSEAPLGRSR